jgi:DNA-nicking Smr family endonuclease
MWQNSGWFDIAASIFSSEQENIHLSPVLTLHPPKNRIMANQPSDKEEDFAKIFKSEEQDAELQILLQEKQREADATESKKNKNFKPTLEIDLHGYTALQAEIKVKSFIHFALKQRVLAVCIITGKGLHSGRQPVLPDTVEDVLGILKKENLVKSWRWEKRQKEKSGALIVQLTS